jgi:hypothetical protein
MESLKTLETQIAKWLEGINKALTAGEPITFSTSKADYFVKSINVDEMKADVTRKSDDKPGKVHVTSYDFEMLYKKLPRKYRKAEDNVDEKPKKIKAEKLKKEKATDGVEKVNKQSVIKKQITEHPGITLADICKEIKKQKLSKITDQKALEANIKANIQFLIKNNKLNAEFKENGYHPIEAK